jgi:serine/threonine-protein kinase
MRPLIAAMLQPAPGDRPESMEAVAAWTPPPATRPRSSAEATTGNGSGLGRVAAVVAALIVVLSIGGTIYFFRDLLPFGSASSSPSSTQEPNAGGAASKPEAGQQANADANVKPASTFPPLPDQPPADKPNLQAIDATDQGSAPGSTTQKPPAEQSKVEPPTGPGSTNAAIQHVPTADEILDTVAAAKNKQPASSTPPASNEVSAKPSPSAEEILKTLLASKDKQGVASNAAKDGEASAKPPPSDRPGQSKAEASAPGPVGPDQKLKVDASSQAPAINLPPFPDLPSDNSPASSSTPPVGETVEKSQDKPLVVASNPPAGSESSTSANASSSQAGSKAEPAPPGPRASQDLVALGEATVGKSYVADLPPFSDGADPKTLALRAEPGMPSGLVLSDLGSGLGEISGSPGKAGQYSFNIVAKDASGASARMAAKLVVLESPATKPSPPSTPAEKAASFLRDFDGGPCFFVRSLGVTGSQPNIFGVGEDKATFQRFYTDFNRDVGIEPQLAAQLIARAQCPAVDLIGSTAGRTAEAPKIELTSGDVGRKQPLAGVVSNLGGRNLMLLLVSSDGQVRKIDTRPRVSGSSAAFSAPLSVNAPAGDVMQVVIAVVSQKPLPSLADFRSGAAVDILPRVQNDLAAADGSLETAFFKLVN